MTDRATHQEVRGTAARTLASIENVRRLAEGKPPKDPGQDWANKWRDMFGEEPPEAWMGGLFTGK